MTRILAALAVAFALTTGAFVYLWDTSREQTSIAQALADSRLHTINQKESEIDQLKLLRADDQQRINQYTATVRTINNQRHMLLVEIEKIRDAKITEFLSMPIPDGLRPILQKRFDAHRKSPDR